MTGAHPETWRGVSLHIVLVEPEIHFNTGNVGRTSLATGAKLHLVKPLGPCLTERLSVSSAARSGTDPCRIRCRCYRSKLSSGIDKGQKKERRKR